MTFSILEKERFQNMLIEDIYNRYKPEVISWLDRLCNEGITDISYKDFILKFYAVDKVLSTSMHLLERKNSHTIVYNTSNRTPPRPKEKESMSAKRRELDDFEKSLTTGRSGSPQKFTESNLFQGANINNSDMTNIHDKYRPATHFESPNLLSCDNKLDGLTINDLIGLNLVSKSDTRTLQDLVSKETETLSSVGKDLQTHNLPTVAKEKEPTPKEIIEKGLNKYRQRFKNSINSDEKSNLFQFIDDVFKNDNPKEFLYEYFPNDELTELAYETFKSQFLTMLKLAIEEKLSRQTQERKNSVDSSSEHDFLFSPTSPQFESKQPSKKNSMTTPPLSPSQSVGVFPTRSTREEEFQQFQNDAKNIDGIPFSNKQMFTLQNLPEQICQFLMNNYTKRIFDRKLFLYILGSKDTQYNLMNESYMGYYINKICTIKDESLKIDASTNLFNMPPINQIAFNQIIQDPVFKNYIVDESSYLSFREVVTLFVDQYEKNNHNALLTLPHLKKQSQEVDFILSINGYSWKTSDQAVSDVSKTADKLAERCKLYSQSLYDLDDIKIDIELMNKEIFIVCTLISKLKDKYPNKDIDSHSVDLNEYRGLFSAVSSLIDIYNSLVLTKTIIENKESVEKGDMTIKHITNLNTNSLSHLILLANLEKLWIKDSFIPKPSKTLIVNLRSLGTLSMVSSAVTEIDSLPFLLNEIQFLDNPIKTISIKPSQRKYLAIIQEEPFDIRFTEETDLNSIRKKLVY